MHFGSSPAIKCLITFCHVLKERGFEERQEATERLSMKGDSWETHKKF